MIYNIDVEQVYSLPAAKAYYQVGAGYCAVGALAKACLNYANLEIEFSEDGIVHMSGKTKEFFCRLNALFTEQELEVITDLNDSTEGNLLKNRNLALAKLISMASDKGLINPLAVEVTNNNKKLIPV